MVLVYHDWWMMCWIFMDFQWFQLFHMIFCDELAQGFATTSMAVEGPPSTTYSKWWPCCGFIMRTWNYVGTHTHTDTHTHAYIHTYIHTYIPSYTQTHTISYYTSLILFCHIPSILDYLISNWQILFCLTCWVIWGNAYWGIRRLVPRRDSNLRHQLLRWKSFMN